MDALITNSNADKVSIILVNYNGLDDTKECIESINASEYSNIDIIVVDNCSSESCDKLSEYSNVVLLKNDNNVGFGIANNIGAEYAVRHGAKYIMCLNNDTIISPDTISILKKHTNEYTITTCATYYYQTDELWYGGGEISRWKGTFRHKKYKNNCNVSFVSGCCFMMEVNTYNKIGLFETDYFMYYEDGDFSIKAINNGINLLYLYETHIWHKVGKSINKSIGMKDYYLTRNRLHIISKYNNYFFRTAYMYFFFTRIIYLFIGRLKGQDVSPIKKGIIDYKNNKMGK